MKWLGDYENLKLSNTLQQFSIRNNDATLVTVDPNFSRTIGQKVELSFNDTWVLNQAYCKGTCRIMFN